MKPGIAGSPSLVGSRRTCVTEASICWHGVDPPDGPQQPDQLSPINDTPQHSEAFSPRVSLNISSLSYRSLCPWTLGLGAEGQNLQ